MARLERDEILTALRASGGRYPAAARSLGVSVRTLRYRMREYGFPPAKRGPKRRPLKRQGKKRGRGLMYGGVAIAMAGAAYLGYRMKKG